MHKFVIPILFFGRYPREVTVLGYESISHHMMCVWLHLDLYSSHKKKQFYMPSYSMYTLILHLKNTARAPNENESDSIISSSFSW